jgi:4a-hydroxytetrahydrobiopterin dehydratase
MPSPLPDAEIMARLALTAWHRDAQTIVRTFDCGSFDGSIAFVNAVAAAANALDHHPDIDLSWDEVTIRVWSHDAGGITNRDFALAAKIDALPRGKANT